MKTIVTTRVAAFLFATAAVVGLPATAATQELGLIYAAVTDRTGQPVTDLRPEEFRIAEDGQDAEVVTARIGTEPMKVALLVDNGVRIARAQALNPLRDAVTGFVDTLPAEHAISLSTIGGHIGWRVGFTRDRSELLESAGDMHADSGSVRFIDGIRETWDRRFDGDEAWPVFVAILTDANEASAFMNENRFNRFVRMLRANGVMVHAVLWTSRARQTDAVAGVHRPGPQPRSEYGWALLLRRHPDRVRPRPAAARGRHGRPPRRRLESLSSGLRTSRHAGHGNLGQRVAPRSQRPAVPGLSPGAVGASSAVSAVSACCSRAAAAGRPSPVSPSRTISVESSRSP